VNLKAFIIPAIDIKDGKLVRLFKGDFEKSKEYGLSPEDAGRLFEELGFRRLHLVDLDGTLEGVPKNLQTIRKLRKVFSGIIQVGGGIRSIGTCRLLDEEGIDFFVVGTVAVREPEVFQKMVSTFPGRVILSVDAKGGKVAIGGWKDNTSLSPEELAKRYEDTPLWGYLYTNIDKDGSLEGVDTRIYINFKRFANKPLLASGGVSSLEDVKKLLGVADGVVIGKALYEGKIDLMTL